MLPGGACTPAVMSERMRKPFAHSEEPALVFRCSR
jgi:hypothetical protein